MDTAEREQLEKVIEQISKFRDIFLEAQEMTPEYRQQQYGTDGLLLLSVRLADLSQQALIAFAR